MSIDMSRKSPAADRISSLPCDILEKILGCLPLRDAVRTSVLSKKWTYRWVVRSELAFDKTIVDGGLLKTIVYQVLLSHRGPVRKFSLMVPSFELFPDVDHWILFLSKKNVQQFSLRFLNSTDFCLPSHLFKFQDLRHLKLCRCKFYPPPSFGAFSTLATLNFSFVTFEPTSFQTLLSSSPLLERVTLVCCTPFDSFIVGAPSLKFFEFWGGANSIFFKTPLLEEIVLALPFDMSESFAVPESQVTLHNVKILKFKSSIFNKVEWVACALHLINRCPNLERLQITSYGYEDQVERVIHLSRSQEMPHSALKQLKSVDMDLVLGNKAEMEFLKYVLSSANALEKVCVVNCVRLSNRRMEMMEEMKQFPQASPSVEFIYKEVDIPFRD